MTTILQLKKIYLDAFRAFDVKVTKALLKSLTWLSFICIAIVVYAFVYRLITGFPI